MPVPKTRPRLDTLAYRCTPALLDGATVHLRDFPTSVTSLWTLLDRQYKELVQREEAQAPHSVLTNALRCLTGGYVFFDPKQGLLATRHQVDDDTLRDAFTLMHGLVLGQHPDDIDLNRPSTLAERIAQTPQEERLLADYLKDPRGKLPASEAPGNKQPDAANWVYRTVAWDLAHRLAQQVWNVDSQEVTLRPDSSGGLVAWHQAWPNKSGTAHAFARVRLALKTLPNVADPVVLVSSQATRVSSRMAYARTVLAEQADVALPIIEVEMAGRGRIRRIHRMSLQTLARLGMDQSVLHGIQQRVDHEQETDAQAEAGTDTAAAAEGEGGAAVPKPAAGLGPIRPLHSKNYRFPVGRGVGMHHLRELDRHIREVLNPATVQIFQDTRARGFKQLRQAELSVRPDDIIRSLDAMAYQHLRIVCLWYRDENRTRMIHGLAGVFGLDPATLDPADGVPLPLNGGRISAVFHCVPDFLTHGPNAGQTASIAHITSLKNAPDTLVGVWAETEFDADSSEEEEPEPQDGSGQESQGRLREDEDAKHQARRTLARLGIVSQFTAERKTSKKKPKQDGKQADHQVILSLLDLCRSLGIIDRRIDQVMVDQIGPHAADQVAQCGIHVRRQSRQGKDRKAKICITASVLKPPADTGEAWTLHGWSYTAPEWQPYHRAQAAFHAAAYPTGKMTEFEDDNQGYKKVAKQIDQALSDLADYLEGTPYTVTVDGVGTRRLWLGLHNRRQGEQAQPGSTWLPASTLAAHERPLAVIRINKDMDEVPRPVQVSHVGGDGKAVRTNKVTNLLYQVEPDFGSPSWLLATVPNQFDGAGAGRLGEASTRWTASHGSNDPENRQKNEVRQNWYSMTATEIYPIITTDTSKDDSENGTTIEPQALALAAARLCHQPLAWANRTRYPVPLHSAQQMDLDHPQYRRTALKDDQTAAGVGETNGTQDDAAPDEQL
ncbi:RNaseH domain-containing protein [Streptomyces mirabilis]|uniref:RNaseH domain-containing protein n=1 Tax=Streptomyces mirabilis TaxID=68239 RepID=UPI003334300B